MMESKRHFRSPQAGVGADTSKLQPGQQIMLYWNGFSGVPQWLGGAIATVVRVTPRGNVVVETPVECNLDGTPRQRTVRPDQIMIEVERA